MSLEINYEISLIVECCKLTQDKEKIERYIDKIEDWERVFNLAFAHGVFPTFYNVLQQYDEILSGKILQQLKYENLHIAKENMLMTFILLQTIKILHKHDIDVFTFKGPVLAQIAYDSIARRQYSDLDILVDEKMLEKSLKILQSEGYFLEKNIYEHIMNNKTNFHDITLKKNGVSVEIHWKLFSDEYKTAFSEDKLAKNSQYIKIFDDDVKTFANEILVLYLAIHGAKHNWERLEWLLDIAKIMHNENLNISYLVQLTKEFHVEKIFYSMLCLCQNILGLALPKELQIHTNEQKILKVTNKFSSLFYANFTMLIDKQEQSKVASYAQYKALHGFKNKFYFLFSLFKPTELEFKMIKLPSYLNFLYYILRPFNILMRRFKKK